MLERLRMLDDDVEVDNMPYFKAHCHDTLTFDATRFHVDVSIQCSMPLLCRSVALHLQSHLPCCR